MTSYDEAGDGVTESTEKKPPLQSLPIPNEKKEKSSKRYRIASKLFGGFRQHRKDRCNDTCDCKDNVFARLGEKYAKAVAVQSISNQEVDEEVECLKARIHFHRGHHNCDHGCNCIEKQGCF
jgi:hypothetical protein